MPVCWLYGDNSPTERRPVRGGTKRNKARAKQARSSRRANRR